jgi:hypothetical protein
LEHDIPRLTARHPAQQCCWSSNMVGQFVFHRLTVLPFLCLVFGFQHIAAALQPSHSAPVALCTCPQSSSSASAQLAACPKVSDQVRGNTASYGSSKPTSAQLAGAELCLREKGCRA